MRFAPLGYPFAALVAAALLTPFAWSAPASDVLLPATTKAYAAVGNYDEAKEHFQQTQWGQLVYDDAMRPFIDSVQKQMEDKFGVVKEHLGLTMSDVDGVPDGELAIAIIERPGHDAGLAVVMNVAHRAKQAEKMLAAADKRLIAASGKKKTEEVSGTKFTIYNMPSAHAGSEPIETVYFIKDDTLIGINGRAEAEAVLKRFTGTPTDNLQSLPAFKATMEKCKAEAKGVEPEARFFVDPFGAIFAGRTLKRLTPKRSDTQDMVKIFQEQGFDAIQGIGGFANMLAPNHCDVLYRVSVYAPPVKGKEGDATRWNLAMQMLQTPNAAPVVPQSWVPRMSARYASYNLEVLNAFDHVDTLFDAIQGHKDAFKTSMEGIELDQYGPQVNLRKELIAHLGNRLTLVTDYTMPITVKSERSVFTVETKNEAQVATAIKKMMEKEPDVERREFGEYVIWERMPPKEDHDLALEAPGFSPLSGDEPIKPSASSDTGEETKEHVLPNSAVCVAFGQLMIASDIEFLRELLGGFGKRDLLVSSDDYKQVETTMHKLVPGDHCGWSFARLDEVYRPTYELIRQNKMPESETLIGKALNRMLTTDEEKHEGTKRKQRLDGSTLPNFEMIRRYFGPAGRILVSEKDGWFLTGTVLDKEAP